MTNQGTADLTEAALERTLVIAKPDAGERRLIGELIKRFEGIGLRIIAIKVLTASDEILRKHYPETLAPIIGEKSRSAGTDVGGDPAAYGRMVLEWNRVYMSRGPVVVMILEGPGAIQRVRDLLGHTDPSKATPGTIRGDLGIDSIAKANAEHRGTENLVHASGSLEESQHEISLWFPEEVTG